MSTFRIFAVLLVLLTAGVCLAEPEGPVLTSAQYAAELDHLLDVTQHLDHPDQQIPAILEALPPKWQVQSESETFSIPTYGLQRDLHELLREPDPDLQKRVVGLLQGLRSDLDAYERTPPDVSKQRAVLQSILARPEFRDIHGPNWIDRLKQRLLEWIFHLLGRVIQSSSIPTIGRVVVYCLIGLAVLVVGLWVYRSIRAGAAMERIVPEAMPVSAKEWTVWMTEAREAARLGKWRDAIHLAYWAGISFLEVSGMWPPDRARTPREYLRLLPASSGHQPALSALTREFEVVWYGNREADANAFSETLAELEKLGCR